jgi:hypothetical protein
VPSPNVLATLIYRFLYSIKMKTTLDIDDELLVRAKAASARERKSLAAIIEEGLRLRLRRGALKPVEAVRLPVFRGGKGFAPGIDPTSNRSIYKVSDDDS